jgi:hypothetical protein
MAAARVDRWYGLTVRTTRGAPPKRLPVSVILAVSMTAAGVVYPVTDSALHHTSPIMRLWLWALAIGLGNTTLTQVGISVGTDRAGAAVAAVLADEATGQRPSPRTAKPVVTHR